MIKPASLLPSDMIPSLQSNYTKTKSAGSFPHFASERIPAAVTGVTFDNSYTCENRITVSESVFNLSTIGIAFYSRAPTFYDSTGNGAAVAQNTDIASIFNLWWNGTGTSYTFQIPTL